VLAGTVGVVAVTSIVALPSKKSPLKPSGQSVHDFVNWVVHSIRRELMIPLTRPSGCAVSSEFGTVKASKTKTSLTFSVALPFFRSTLTPPLEIGAVHIFSLGLTPGSHECGPNGLAAAWLSSHMKAHEPWRILPSGARNFPDMKRMSVWNW